MSLLAPWKFAANTPRPESWRGLVTVNTQRATVRDYEPQFRKVRELLDMICVQLTTSFLTVLAGVIVTLEDPCSPLSVCCRASKVLQDWRDTTFPCWVFRTEFRQRPIRLPFAFMDCRTLRSILGSNTTARSPSVAYASLLQLRCVISRTATR